MQLKPEALNAFKLPIKVKAGFLGFVRLKVRSLSLLLCYPCEVSMEIPEMIVFDTKQEFVCDSTGGEITVCNE